MTVEKIIEKLKKEGNVKLVEKFNRAFRIGVKEDDSWFSKYFVVKHNNTKGK